MSVSILEAMERRRTIRNYDPDYKMPKEQLDAILHAGQIAPTACDFQGSDFIVLTNKEKLKGLCDTLLTAMPDSPMKSHFTERKERHGVENVLTCDAPYLILIVRNERADKDWDKVDCGIQTMAMIMAAQHFGIESMCLGAISTPNTHEACEKYLGLKPNSLILGLSLGKIKGNPICKPREIKSKVSYIE